MFILLVHNHYKSTHFGGEDLVFRQEAEMLRKRLGQNHILTYEVHNDQNSLFSIVFNLFFPLMHAIRIRKLVAQHRIDVVHVHNDFPILSLWFMRILKGLNCVRIQTLHNYRQWCISGILYRPNRGICEDCLTKKSRIFGVLNGCYRQSRVQSMLVYLAQGVFRFFSLANEVDQYFCLSDHQRRKLISFGVQENRVILKPNFIRKPEIVRNSQKEIDFLFVGRLEESKGIFKVLDSVDVEMLKKIQVIGHTEEMELIRKKYPGVVFHGKKSNPEVLAMMAKSRFVLQPSLCYETFGLTLMEAMGLGVPVIGFPIGTREEYIKDGVNGFLMNENSIQSDLQRALNYSNYETIASNALAFSSGYQDEYIIDKQLAIYQQLIRLKRKQAA